MAINNGWCFSLNARSFIEAFFAAEPFERLAEAEDELPFSSRWELDSLPERVERLSDWELNRSILSVSRERDRATHLDLLKRRAARFSREKKKCLYLMLVVVIVVLAFEERRLTSNDVDRSTEKTQMTAIARQITDPWPHLPPHLNDDDDDEDVGRKKRLEAMTHSGFTDQGQRSNRWQEECCLVCSAGICTLFASMQPNLTEVLPAVPQRFLCVFKP